MSDAERPPDEVRSEVYVQKGGAPHRPGPREPRRPRGRLRSGRANSARRCGSGALRFSGICPRGGAAPPPPC